MQRGVVNDAGRDPLGEMIRDCWHGHTDVYVTVESDTLEMSDMPGSIMLRGLEEMDAIERLALSECRGRILDVGAGSGSHSLILQERGLDVESIDVSPGCVEVMQARGVKNPRHCNLQEQELGRFDTILMLMNGLGICGTVAGLNDFMQQLEWILSPAGQVLADSTDLTDAFADYVDEDDACYCGETEFVMRYKEAESEPFNWLYIDFELLRTIAAFNGYRCEKLLDGDGGHFLCRIFK